MGKITYFRSHPSAQFQPSEFSEHGPGSWTHRPFLLYPNPKVDVEKLVGAGLDISKEVRKHREVGAKTQDVVPEEREAPSVGAVVGTVVLGTTFGVIGGAISGGVAGVVTGDGLQTGARIGAVQGVLGGVLSGLAMGLGYMAVKGGD